MKINKLKKIATVLLSSAMIFGMLGVNSNAWSYIPYDHDLGACAAAPSDYTGLGYWFKKEGIDVQVTGSSFLNHGFNNNSKIILGDISAYIVKMPDGTANLHFYAKYELDMDCWIIYAKNGASSKSEIKSPYTNSPSSYTDANYLSGKTTSSDKTIPVTYVYDTFDYEFNTARELTDYIANAKDGVAHFNTYTGRDALDVYTNYVDPNWTTPMSPASPSYQMPDAAGVMTTYTPNDFPITANYAGGWDYSWCGPDGNLQLKMSVNGGKEVLVNIPYSLPANYWVREDKLYHHEIEATIPIDSSYGDVRGVRITSIEGTPVNFFVTGDGEDCFPQTKIVDGVGYVGVTSANATTKSYTVQVNALPPVSGYYDVIFQYQKPGSSCWYDVHVDAYISSVSGCQEFLKVNVPSDATNLFLSKIVLKGHDPVYGAYDKRCFQEVDDWRFGVNFISEHPYASSQRVTFNERIEYSNIHIKGDYEFTYNYITYEDNYPVSHSVTLTYNFDSFNGTYRPTLENSLSSVIPANAAEVRLCNVKAPTGYIKYMNQVIFTNEAMIPEIPADFTISMTLNRVEVNAGGVNIHTAFNYTSPERARYRVVYEYVIDGVAYYKTKTFTVNPGYGVITYGDGSTDSTNAVAFSPNVSSIKICRIETADGTPIVSDFDGTVIYTCTHKYSNECGDLECNYCHAMRDASELTAEHKPAGCNVPSCSECGAYIEPVDHVYENDCADRECAVCGYIRPVSELSAHNYGRSYGIQHTCRAMYCLDCGERRPYVSMDEHNWQFPCSTECRDCHATRNFVGDPHSYGADGRCICGAVAPTGPRVLNVPHYWQSWDECVDGKPVYYSGPLNNGDWGAEITLVSYMPAAIGNVGITYTVEYNGQVIYTGNCATASVNISKIPSGFAAGTYTISFYEADGSFIYSDSCTVIDHE